MKTIFITGASSGIGRQLAVDYARKGHWVVACGRSRDKLSKLTEQFENMQMCLFDTTDREQVTQAIDSLSVIPDIWILNAGDCQYVDDGILKSDVIRQVMDANFMGTVHCLEAIQSVLKPGHHLVMTGSIASVLGLPRAAAYGASKAALHYLFRSLQQDWKDRGLVFSFIMPGFVQTPLTDRNSFPMPMRIPVEQASRSIIRGIEFKQAYIYFPRRFTWIIRLIGLLPFEWQRSVVNRFVQS
ncbi:SDR family NAD(P)-dependent oxidoreductase [Vibrio salinus]|uniref:SDR family NAD(P)-dependent oxidoreductase n=1 Tax=Vibrio salinus TaxID=2899784 RepID=UPI001E426701|nr:SDR family NAD(P)-dependent oxidoreductase [Vibrio salinus]MCE0496238.1 SDR family NAD(P)-dependent oxidoreductase [Vibrio salinus]